MGTFAWKLMQFMAAGGGVLIGAETISWKAKGILDHPTNKFLRPLVRTAAQAGTGMPVCVGVLMHGADNISCGRPRGFRTAATSSFGPWRDALSAWLGSGCV